MIEEANDEIACLKSKLHGLRLIITQLKLVEVKYHELKKNPEITVRSNYFLLVFLSDVWLFYSYQRLWYRKEQIHFQIKRPDVG